MRVCILTYVLDITPYNCYLVPIKNVCRKYLSAIITEETTSLLEWLYVDTITDHRTVYTSKETPLHLTPNKLMFFCIITVVSLRTC